MHVPGCLSIGSHSEWNTRTKALINPQLKGGKWQPQVHAVIYIYVSIFYHRVTIRGYIYIQKADK